MPSYSLEKRGEILYNHLYFGDLPETYVREILRGEYYLEIVKHGKFNPRIVKWLSDFVRVRGIAPRDYQGFVKDLMDDPTEIWRHAYEQEISEAARTVLLLLFSRGGAAQLGTVRAGFARLHEVRCRRYGVRSRPEDFESALREISGSFARVNDRDRVEVLDASVLDLMNSVVGSAMDNAVDIVAGATEFEQVAMVWMFSKTDKGASIVGAMCDATERMVANVERCMISDARSTDAHYRWRSLERRFPIVAEMANELGQEISRLVGRLFEVMAGNWEASAPAFGDVIGVRDAVAACKVLSVADVERMSQIAQKALLSASCDGYFSEELLSVASVLEKSESPKLARKALAKALDEYADDSLEAELDDCQEPDQFDELMGRLEELHAMIGAEVHWLIEHVSEKKHEFERRRAEREEEEAREAEALWYEEGWSVLRRAEHGRVRVSDGRGPASGPIVAVRDMFGSLGRR